MNIAKEKIYALEDEIHYKGFLIKETLFFKLTHNKYFIFIFSRI